VDERKARGPLKLSIIKARRRATLGLSLGVIRLRFAERSQSIKRGKRSRFVPQEGGRGWLERKGPHALAPEAGKGGGGGFPQKVQPGRCPVPCFHRGGDNEKRRFVSKGRETRRTEPSAWEVARKKNTKTKNLSMRKVGSVDW